MTKEDYINQIRSLDNNYYDLDLSDWSFKQLKDLIESLKYPYAKKENYEEYTSGISGEDTIFYSNGIRQRRRAYQ